MNEVVVGYSSNRKKQKNFFEGLVAAANRWRGRYGRLQQSVFVRMVPLCDGEAPPGVVLDAVLHKRTDDMAAAVSGGDESAARRLAALGTFLDGEGGGERDNVIAVDPLKGVWRLVDRRRISEAVDRSFGHGRVEGCIPHCKNVSTVSWTEVPVRDGSQAVQEALLGRLNFPIILKRRLACGTKASHEMVIAYDMDGALAAVKSVFCIEDTIRSVHKKTSAVIRSERSMGLEYDDTDEYNFDEVVIAQEFITNHGGVLFKLYAIGTHVVVQARSSVQHTLKGPQGGYYYFDSQRLHCGDFSFDTVTGCSKMTEAVMPSPKLAAAIVEALTKELGLSLIGIDVVYDVHSKKYYIVDINYFPGYKGVSTAYEWVLEHICNLVWQRLEDK